MAITQLIPRAGMRRPIAAGTIIEVAFVLMIRIKRNNIHVEKDYDCEER